MPLGEKRFIGAGTEKYASELLARTKSALPLLRPFLFSFFALSFVFFVFPPPRPKEIDVKIYSLPQMSTQAY